MDFTLSKKHEMARQLFKDFAENEVKPLAQEIDEEHRFPRETVEKMAKAGFMGIPVPKELGGQGCDPLTYAMCVEELSKVCGTTGVIVSAHTSLCVDPIQTFGTDAQKAKYLPDLCSGKKLGAFGLTEPGAGTDAQGQQTKAVFDEATNEWVLNGSKCFITNGKEADVYVIIAVTGKIEKRGRVQKEISAFLVEKGTPGFTFGTKENKMGICASSTYELIFTDCRIPKENPQGFYFTCIDRQISGERTKTILVRFHLWQHSCFYRYCLSKNPGGFPGASLIPAPEIIDSSRQFHHLLHSPDHIPHIGDASVIMGRAYNHLSFPGGCKHLS